MRILTFRHAGALLVMVLALGLATARPAQAQQPITIVMSVTEEREPGLMGTATITPLPNNQVRVDIRMTGLPPNDVPRPAHIHTAPGARCDTGAPVTYPLNNVIVDAAGVGTSSTVITLTPDAPVTANNAYINVHNPAQMGRGVFCGDITVTLTGLPAAPAAPPAAQKPAVAPAQPAAQRPAAVPAQPGRPVPVAVPRAGTGGIRADAPAAWSLVGLATIVLLLTGTAALAHARRTTSAGPTKAEGAISTR